MSNTHLAPAAVRQQFTLPNGLRVVVEEDHSAPAVAVNLWYGVGSRHEQPGRTGLAHLFEHLMFQGSEHVASGEHFALLDAMGADLNATTSQDRTNYFEAVPREGLDLALWLEADRMGGLLASLDQTNLDNQRDVVRNERRQRMDNQPYGTALEHLFANTFAPGHQYHHLPIGSMEDVAAATLDDVRNFFTEHYTPANAVLSLVGDVDAGDALARIERYFGGIDAGPALTARAPQHEAMSGARIDITDEEVPAPLVYFMWPTPADGHPDCDRLDLVIPLLVNAASSRLNVELVRRRQIASSVGGGHNRLVGGRSAFLFAVQGREGIDPQQLVDEASEIVTSFGAQDPTPQEAAIAQASYETGFLAERESFAWRADSLSHGLCLFDDPSYDDRTLQSVREVTAPEISRVVREHLDPEQATILTYTPRSA